LEGDLSNDVRTFLTNHIVSVEELELLLALYRQRDRDWSVTELNAQLRSQSSSVERWLRVLQSFGLLSEAEGRFRFQAPESLTAHVAAVEAAYRERWTKVIEFIYFKPNEKLLSFTRAFDFRKRP
jgi:hypothetical protein